jgi:peroxiredoxin Q/BCP
MFKGLNAEIIGVSRDGQKTHSKFAQDERLPFTLLSDPDGALRKAYGVKPTVGLIPGRATFVIDKRGIIRHIYSVQFRPEQHVREALMALESIAD